MPKRTDIIPEINKNTSPMMRQYIEIKRRNPDSILFFRLGDFYEMFYNDAVVASQELDLTLTGRAAGEKDKAPMCGVPYHSCEAYIARLIKKGYRVAVCEQTEDPATCGKKLVDREVIRKITPGTLTDQSMLDKSRNNYLGVVYFYGGKASCCFSDVSTGDLHLTTIASDTVGNDVVNELTRFAPKELVLNPAAAADRAVSSFLKLQPQLRIEIDEDDEFQNVESQNLTLEHFKADSFESIGADEISKCALSRTVSFLFDTQRNDLSAITDIDVYSESQYMKLDYAARTNLELTQTIRGGSKSNTLLSVIDQTKTPMGKRLIRTWLERPLVSLGAITRRQNAVGELYSNIALREEIGEILSGVRDLERLIARVTYKTVNPKEMIALRDTAGKMPALKAATANCSSRLLCEINADIDELRDVYDLISSALEDDPPVTLREGRLIRRGYSETIDECYRDMTGGKQIVRDIEERERERTGVKKLKIKYNRVFGYYIEVPTSATEFVKPEEYVRRQTLANAERYSTDEVRQLESRILGAQDRLYALEYDLFCKIRDSVGEAMERVRITAQAVAKLDALYSLAKVAYENSYICPQMTADGVIEIIGGRHPVIEQLTDMAFVPNDTLLDKNENRCAIITGPNMAGKSTYMRQVAVITLMAHIGSFVPATSAKIALTDAIFTRVGASDDLAMGQSTFMVEMSEIADILKNATADSLLIIDEIGRGTSTYDGMAIARAVLEYVADKRKLGAKTLFATHYHELAVLEESLQGVKNYNIAAKKRGDEVIFLRKIVRGGADDSYGIEVAKLAGVPQDVITRAKKILKSLDIRPKAEYERIASSHDDTDDGQITLGKEETKSIIKELKTMDIYNMTPLEAMQQISELAEKAKNV